MELQHIQNHALLKRAPRARGWLLAGYVFDRLQNEIDRDVPLAAARPMRLAIAVAPVRAAPRRMCFVATDPARG